MGTERPVSLFYQRILQIHIRIFWWQSLMCSEGTRTILSEAELCVGFWTSEDQSWMAQTDC